MTLSERLRADLTKAIKQRDEVATAALRMALAAVKREEVAGAEARTLGDDEIERVLAKEMKSREEAAEGFRSGGREERALRELAEREVLARYLPEPLSPAELEAVVDEVLAAEGLSGMGSMGPAMKAVTARVGGRASGKAVAEVVRARLSAGD